MGWGGGVGGVVGGGRWGRGVGVGLTDVERKRLRSQM